MSLANVSQHLQTLRTANLVESQRSGNMIVYRLSDPAVVDLWLALRGVAESRLAEVERLSREFLPRRDNGYTVPATTSPDLSGVATHSFSMSARAPNSKQATCAALSTYRLKS